MDILIGDDDNLTLRLLSEVVRAMGHTPKTFPRGDTACEALLGADAPRLALLDWEMPGLAGVEVVRRVRASRDHLDAYIILLTARQESTDVVAGLEAGANDYVKKPFQQAELIARIKVGLTVVQLQEQVQTLKGLLPVCSWCKQIRDDDNQWHAVEHYIAARTAARFTHGICPTCIDKMRVAKV